MLAYEETRVIEISEKIIHTYFHYVKREMVEYKKKEEVFGIYGTGFQTMGGAMLCFQIEHTWDTMQNRVKEE